MPRLSLNRRTRTAIASAIAALPLAVAAQATAHADTLVLVQGYLGSANSYRATGIAQTLVARGFQDAGHLALAPDGRFRAQPITAAGKQRFYTVELPTEAPVALQARVLGDALVEVASRHSGEPLHVVGHSAGGVVARFAAVTDQRVKPATLLTIASPHLGTATAEVGSMIGNSPLSWVAPFFGASTINRSQALYQDLWRERPGTALGWLNRQPHPDMRYISVLRTNGGAPLAGDSVVDGVSQDMNAVPALARRSEVYVTAGGHGLNPGDGILIADLIGRAAQQTAAATPAR
ncbi:MAG: esterase/lipase family protein [Hyphomicrobiaceae bacterium]